MLENNKMSATNTQKIAITLDLRVPANVIEKHLPASPYVVGEQIAVQVLSYVNAKKLGYFPALEYFRGKSDALDDDLLNAADNITWLVSNLVREEITVKLRPVFSSVHVESVQAHAFKMPGVRLHAFNLDHELASHYTPDHFRVSVVLTMPRESDETRSSSSIANNIVNKWLRDQFSNLKITSVSFLNKQEE